MKKTLEIIRECIADIENLDALQLAFDDDNHELMSKENDVYQLFLDSYFAFALVLNILLEPIKDKNITAETIVESLDKTSMIFNEFIDSIREGLESKIVISEKISQKNYDKFFQYATEALIIKFLDDLLLDCLDQKHNLSKFFPEVCCDADCITLLRELMTNKTEFQLQKLFCQAFNVRIIELSPLEGIFSPRGNKSTEVKFPFNYKGREAETSYVYDETNLIATPSITRMIKGACHSETSDETPEQFVPRAEAFIPNLENHDAFIAAVKNYQHTTAEQQEQVRQQYTRAQNAARLSKVKEKNKLLYGIFWAYDKVKPHHKSRHLTFSNSNRLPPGTIEDLPQAVSNSTDQLVPSSKSEKPKRNSL